jgi:hypothetical protein
MGEMQERQANLDRRLAKLDGTFESLEGSAGHLQSTINQTAESLQMLTVFNAVPVRRELWIGGLLLIIGAWFANRRIAGCLMAITGFFTLISATGVIEILLKRVSSLAVRSRSVFHSIGMGITWFPRTATSLALMASAVAVGFTIKAWVRRTCLYFYEDAGCKGVFPRIEKTETV